MPILRYIDVVLVVAAAPIALLMGVPAVGYGVAVGVWILVRAVGVLIDRLAETTSAQQAMSLRLGYMLGRLFVLALAVVLVRRGAGRDDGLTALIVLVVAFTLGLGASFATRGRGR